MTRYHVSHRTVYRYQRPVRFGEHRLILHPGTSHNIQVHHTDLHVSPSAHLSWSNDSYGNKIGTVKFRDRARHLVFDSTLVASTTPSKPLSYSLRLPGEAEDRPVTNEVQKWASKLVEDDVRSTLLRMVREVFNTMEYRSRTAEGTQSALETLKKGMGSCRDFTVLLAGAVEHLGLRTRVVTGYIYSKDRDIVPAPSGGATHAWLQVQIPTVGWYDVDPTHGQLGNENLIPVAAWPHYQSGSVAPVSGTWIGCVGEFIDMKVTVNVHREKDHEDRE